MEENKQNEIVIEEEQKEEQKANKLVGWYMEHRKLVMGLLCAFATVFWLTARVVFTQGVLFVGKLGRPEYTDLYTRFRDEYLDVDTNVVMAKFKLILFIIAFVFFLCNGLAPSSYERQKCPAICNWLINVALVVLGFLMLIYGAILIGWYKILSVVSILYIVVGVFCFVLLIFASKDFSTEHPDSKGLKITSYIFGILGIILIVASSMGIVKEQMTSLNNKKEAYYQTYKAKVWSAHNDNIKDTDNRIYLKLHFYNKYNQEGKNYDYGELMEAYDNYFEDEGSSWNVYKEFSDDYFELASSHLFDNYEYTREAMIDYSHIVQQQLYYDGYCYGFEYNQPEIPIEAMMQACQKADEIFLTHKSVQNYDKDVVITAESSLIVGQQPSFVVSCGDNAGEFNAYIYNIGRVNYAGSEKCIEEHNYKSQEELIIKDDSVYLLKLMVASDLEHSFSEDINITVDGIEYEAITITEQRFGYNDESLQAECGAFNVYIWVTTGDCDGSYQDMESLGFEVPKGFCQGENIEKTFNMDTVKVDNTNVVLTKVNWEADYPSQGHYDDVEFSHEPKMYKLYTYSLCETGYKFSEDIECSANGSKLPKCNYEVSDFWSGGSVSLGKDNLSVHIYYYRITTDTKYQSTYSTDKEKHGSLDINYDYAATGTIVTLNPKPDRGYKLKEYIVEIDLKNADKYEKWKPVIENDTFVMPAAPIRITAVFEEE